MKTRRTHRTLRKKLVNLDHHGDFPTAEGDRGEARGMAYRRRKRSRYLSRVVAEVRAVVKAGWISRSIEDKVARFRSGEVAQN